VHDKIKKISEPLFIITIYYHHYHTSCEIMRRQPQNGAEWCEEFCAEQLHKLAEYYSTSFERVGRCVDSLRRGFIDMGSWGKFVCMMALFFGLPISIGMLCGTLNAIGFWLFFVLGSAMSAVFSFVISPSSWGAIVAQDGVTTRRSRDSSPSRVTHRC
jgi:hypothetical protein